MTLAEISWLNISINLLLIVFVVVCLLMILLVLMQRPKQEGLGATFGSGVTDQVWGSRTTDVLQKGTRYLAAAFFLLALTLTILYSRKNQIERIGTTPIVPEKQAEAEQKKIEKSEESAETPSPAAPVETPAPAPVPAPEAAPAEVAPEAPAPPAAPAAEVPAPESGEDNSGQ